jgi:hypothetical protein
MITGLALTAVPLFPEAVISPALAYVFVSTLVEWSIRYSDSTSKYT